MRKFSAWVVTVCMWAGCSRTPAESPPPAETPAAVVETSGTDGLADSDLQRLLAVIQATSARELPEFIPDDNDSPDFDQPARDIGLWFRDKLHQVYDSERQGRVWERDPEWRAALAAARISGPEFASLVQQVTLAVLRIRLESRSDLDSLENTAKQEVRRCLQQLSRLETRPRSVVTAEARTQRAELALELGRIVALREMLKLIREVPEEHVAVIRRNSRKLKPVLPARMHDDLLAELAALVPPREKQVQQASYQASENATERRSAGKKRAPAPGQRKP